MLGVGTPIFIIVPDESEKQIFHHGRVLEANDESFVAEFDHLEPLPAGFSVSAYNEVDGKFFEQKATVTALVREKPNPIIAFERVGLPTSAERRGSYRVRMLKVTLAGQIGEERRCDIMDISPEGFSAVTIKALDVGSLVNVRIAYESYVLDCPVHVQSVYTLANGRHRCGFMVPENNVKMRRCLERISSMIQRLHLRSLAEYRVLDANVEVNGETIQAVIEGMGAFKATALKILAKQGIVNPEPGEWYSQQALLNALGVISDKLGAEVLYNIGLKIPENTLFPPGIDSLDKAMNSLDSAFHMNHRNGNIGHYHLGAVRETSFEIICENSYPCDLDKGLLVALCGHFKPKGSDSHATVLHDDKKPCRKNGADSCTYNLTW
jgi:hypothetical protein